MQRLLVNRAELGAIPIGKAASTGDSARSAPVRATTPARVAASVSHGGAARASETAYACSIGNV